MPELTALLLIVRVATEAIAESRVVDGGLPDRPRRSALGRTISVSPNIEIWLYGDNLVLAGT